MKFHIGPMPEIETFDPEAEGWTKIETFGPIRLQMIAVPIALFVVLLFAGFLFFFWPPERVDPSTSYFLTLCLFLIPLHELIHAATFPGGIFSPSVTLGFWPAKLLPYAYYEESINRRRMLLVYFAPLFVLSILPVVLILLFRSPAIEVATFAVVNAAASTGDLIGIFLVGSQVPRSARIRGKGWNSYWKV